VAVFGTQVRGKEMFRAPENSPGLEIVYRSTKDIKEVITNMPTLHMSLLGI